MREINNGKEEAGSNTIITQLPHTTTTTTSRRRSHRTHHTPKLHASYFSKRSLGSPDHLTDLRLCDRIDLLIIETHPLAARRAY